jgi:hypothetical protein
MNDCETVFDMASGGNFPPPLVKFSAFRRGLDLVSGRKVGGDQEVKAEAEDYENGGDGHEFHVLMFQHGSPRALSFSQG